MEQEQNTRPRKLRFGSRATVIPTPLAPWAVETSKLAAAISGASAFHVCSSLDEDSDRWEYYLPRWKEAERVADLWNRIYDHAQANNIPMEHAFFSLPTTTETE